MGARRRTTVPRAVTAATTAVALLLPTLASSLSDESAPRLLPSAPAAASAASAASAAAANDTAAADIAAASSASRLLYDADHRIEAARIYGNIDAYAYYYIDLLIGKPAQRVSVIVDTGSGVTAFPCKACSHCGHHLDPNFDFSKSLTAKWTACGSGCTCSQGHCSYSQGYTEGSSISGWYFTDEVQLGDALQHNPPVRMSLGCHQKENNLFYTQKANGIMGIRPPGKSPTIFDTLYADKAHINGKIFTLCLAEWGGELTVGGVNASYHRGEVQKVPLITRRGFYHVSLTEMSVGGKVVGTRFGTTMIDSGTTYTYMSQQNYKSLRSLIETQCAHGACGATLSGTCWDAPNGVGKFPFVEMTFDQRIKTRWDPRAYLYRKGGKGTSNKFCYAFENDGINANTVLGASWMMYKDVIFDLQADTVGIAPAECPSYKTRPTFSPDGEGPDPAAPKPVRTPLSEIVAASEATHDKKTKDDDDDDDDDEDEEDDEEEGKADKAEESEKAKEKHEDEDEDEDEDREGGSGKEDEKEQDEEDEEDKDEDKDEDEDKDDETHIAHPGKEKAPFAFALDEEGRPLKHSGKIPQKKSHHKKEDTRTAQRVVAIIGAVVLATLLVCAVCLVMMARQHNDDENGAPVKKGSKNALEEGAEMVGLKQLEEDGFSGEEDPLVAAVVQDPMVPNGQLENGVASGHHHDEPEPARLSQS